MKDRMAIPIFLPASAASNSSWATFLNKKKYSVYLNIHFLLNVVSEFPQGGPELHHVLGDGVEVLQCAVDVARALLHVQGVVQDDLVTDGGYSSFVLLQVVFVCYL